MEDPRDPMREPRQRWFDDDALPEPSARVERNHRRPPPAPRWSPPLLLNWVLFCQVVLVVLLYSYLKDDPLPWEGDIRRAATQEFLPGLAAPSRLVTVLRLAERLDVAALPAVPVWQWDRLALARLLEGQMALLDCIQDLLEEKPEQWQPRNPLWMIEDLGSRPGWAAVATVKQAEAEYLAGLGQERAAFLAAADLAVLAHRLERLDTWPSFMGLALDFHERSAESLAVLLKQTQLSPEVLASLQQTAYQPWAPTSEALRAAMSGYYAYERKLLLGADVGEHPLPPDVFAERSGWLFFKPNATLRLFTDSLGELKTNTRQTAVATTHQLELRLQKMRRSRGVFLPTSNYQGEEYFATRIQPYIELTDRHYLVRAKRAAVMTLFAFRRYVAKEARLPPRIADLIPDYLPASVIDPYSGEPLCYNATRGLIYSVGTDLKDEGGRPTVVPLAEATEPTVETGIGMASTVR
ncbi:MAG: hypothetical protein ACOYMN_05610 [Roseimicrobium sp.]